LHDYLGQLVVPSGINKVRDAQLAHLLATPVGQPGALVPEGTCLGLIELTLNRQHTLVVLNTV
jgi:hypothetical protein